MDSDYSIPRELFDLQKLRSLYQPELPPCLQGTTVRVEGCGGKQCMRFGRQRMGSSEGDVDTEQEKEGGKKGHKRKYCSN